MLARLLTFAASEGFNVDFVETCAIRGAQGTSKGNQIQISNGLDTTTQAATLAHEIAHSLLHWAKDGSKLTSRDGKTLDKQQRELEAEATAYVVCNYFGVQSPSDFYLATYKVTSAMLLAAVETISGTAKKILEGCQKSESESESESASAPEMIAVMIPTVPSELVVVAA
jgi:IrrE N-terminal-like domain